MKIKSFLIIILVILNVIPYGNNIASNNYLSKDEKISSDIEDIFKKFEEGLIKSDVSIFSSYFGGRTFISLSNGVTGSYSSNQAYYILQEYFNSYKPSSFKYQNINIETDNPFAHGIYRYDSRGIRGTVQVYISLTKNGTDWQISQITII